MTQRTLAHGERMVATLNQPQYSPWPFEEQVAAIFAGINGYLADIPTPQVPRFQEELREHLRTEGVVYAAIRDAGDLADELQETLHAEIKKLKERFNVQEETSLVGRPRRERRATIGPVEAPTCPPAGTGSRLAS